MERGLLRDLPGAADALSKDDSTYAAGFDRRADINLPGVVHAPR